MHEKHVVLLMTTNHATADKDRRKCSVRVPATDSSFIKNTVLSSNLRYSIPDKRRSRRTC